MLTPPGEARFALAHLVRRAATIFRIEVLTMKDVLFVLVTAAFFAVALLYAKSFDQL